MMMKGSFYKQMDSDLIGQIERWMCAKDENPTQNMPKSQCLCTTRYKMYFTSNNMPISPRLRTARYESYIHPMICQNPYV